MTENEIHLIGILLVLLATFANVHIMILKLKARSYIIQKRRISYVDKITTWTNLRELKERLLADGVPKEVAQKLVGAWRIYSFVFNILGILFIVLLLFVFIGEQADQEVKRQKVKVSPISPASGESPELW